MLRRFIFLFLLCFFLFFSSFGESFLVAEEIRKPVYAGQFYEANPDRLSSRIDVYLNAVAKLPELPRDPEVIIVPHAGYIYSGQTAAYAYALLKNRAYETVVIIGPSHQVGFNGCSIWPRGGFETPLGVVPVDEAVCSLLMKATGFGFLPEAQAKEHSVEVQVPFLQKTQPAAKIVPVVTGFANRRTIERLAEGLLASLSGKKALVVVSTDMSHYLPRDEAKAVDQATINLVSGLKTEALLRQVVAGENILCGGAGVVAALLYLQKRGEPRVEILHYADSSEAGGPVNQVVGYFAAAGYLISEKVAKAQEKTLAGTASQVGAASEEAFSLSPQEKKELLQLAKQAVELYVREGRVLSYHPENDRLWEEKGAFVTLKKRGQLRGCIGYIEPVLPLYLAVIRCAILAATEDPRFPSVEPKELNSLEYEISVLTNPQRITNPREVVVGRHGLIISLGGKKGVLLPQVPVEEGWDRDTFLEQVCLKAGLPPNAWRSTEAELFVFEAIVFH